MILTKYARYLLHKKYYPRQASCQNGRVSNTNKAVYNMLTECGARNKRK